MRNTNCPRKCVFPMTLAASAVLHCRLPDELTDPIFRDCFEIAVQKKQSKFLMYGDTDSFSPALE